MTRDEEEYEFERKNNKSLKEKVFGGGQDYQERKYLQELKNKENREIDGIASRKVTQVPRTFGQLVESQAMKVHDAYRLTKHEGAAYVGAGISRILNYPQEKLHDWTEDYRLNREYNQGKKDARHLTNPDLLQETDVKKIPSKLKLENGKSLAYVRGATEGVYHENMKLHNVHQRESDRRDREIKKYTREEKKKDVTVDAKKAYAVERAKTAGRLAARDERRAAQLERQQYQQQMYAQQYAQQQVAPQPRRMVPFFSYEGGRAVDPLNIYSLPKQRQPQNQQQNQFRQQAPQQQSQPAPNMDFMNFLLGGQENPHSGKPRKKIYNFFKGIYE